MKHYVILGIQDSYYGFSIPLVSFSDREAAQAALDRLNNLVALMEIRASNYNPYVKLSWLKEQEDFKFLLDIEPNFLLRDGRSYSKERLVEKQEIYVPEPYELIEVEFAG